MKDTPEIPHNVGGRLQSRKGGLITKEMNNCKRGAPLKTTPTNKKIKGKRKAPTKSAAASTAAIKKSPKTKPPTITAGRKYTNWKQDPAKSALECDVEEKLKGLDTQLASGEIIITDGSLQDHARYAKGEANNMWVSLIIYLKYFS